MVRETDRLDLEQEPPEPALREQSQALMSDDGTGGDPFDMTDGGGLLDPDNTDGMFTDDRDQQGTLDVGMGAGVTEDRSGQIAGSANFADERDDLMPDQDVGEQAGLLEQETNVGGDGQTDLFGGNASETSGAEYRL
jgi:hypothetical protein